MTSDPEGTLRVSRVIPADPEAVFRAWTHPDLIPRWHGPPGGRILDVQLDLVEGGAFSLRMEGADGRLYHVFGVYQEVTAPRRLVYTWDVEGADDWVGETLVTVEFLREGESTRVVITHEGFPTARDTEGPRGGWIGCLDQLEGVFAYGSR
ncbi:MAG: SRPBCC domain-containing protein [Gemmatimonadota bacterium]|nr:SRPBCC domain-containing protein [Gemmatimonadota bacterium]